MVVALGSQKAFDDKCRGSDVHGSRKTTEQFCLQEDRFRAIILAQHAG